MGISKLRRVIEKNLREKGPTRVIATPKMNPGGSTTIVDSVALFQPDPNAADARALRLLSSGATARGDFFAAVPRRAWYGPDEAIPEAMAHALEVLGEDSELMAKLREAEARRRR